MSSKLQPLHFLAAIFLLTAGAQSAAAHCCHDSRVLGIAQQSEFRRGLHGMNDGVTDDSIEADPPTIGDGLNDGRGNANQGIGGLGQMHGNSIGNYGAGSLGQTGPGGLGAMRGNGIGGPVHPVQPR